MVIGARKGSSPLDAVSTLQADSFIHTRRRRNTPTTMAGHRAVFLALTLVTWLPWLQQTTGQEVSSVEEIVKTCTGRDVQSLCDPEGILTEEEELEIRRSLNASS
ncbi:Hypp7980 [Branchiostoma lanceolatum]|uniref:Hypp7980 protein n=1 Tax=Branchiostoma lanceolatum TaxID=7740 RepID=A0A8J9Z5U2_BRALA|nr:Hypp7980 [Branchiostoma lanceolatum]